MAQPETLRSVPEDDVAPVPRLTPVAPLLQPAPPCSPQAVEASGCCVYYPMWVMPVRLALGIRDLLPHQDLKRQGHITEFLEGTMVAIFVSHQWVAVAHPDPDLRQFGILQAALHNILTGSVHVQGDPAHQSVYKSLLRMTASQVEELRVAYIWYDWFSCPQPTAASGEDVNQLLQAAIDSIPAYVNLSGYMVILAPPVSRQDGSEPADCDYHTWRTRSWCRLELLAWVLAEGKPPVMLIQGSRAVHFMNAMCWLNDVPGMGALSVESDRPKILQVTQRMLQWKLQRLRTKGDLHDWRFLQALRSRILQGRADPPAYDEVGVFLRDFEFATALDGALLGAGVGWTPLHYASIAGEGDIVAQLVGARSDPDARIGEPYPPGMLSAGATALILAASLGTDGCVRALLRLGADARLTCSQGFTVLMGLVRNSRATPGLIDDLLRARAALEQASAWPVSLTALHMAAMVSPPGMVCALLDMRADARTLSISGNVLTASTWNSAEVVRLLLERGMDPNFSWDTRWSSRWLLCMVARGLSRCGAAVAFLEGLAMSDGSTPLMHAVRAGNTAAVRALLSARADVGAANSAGQTAAALALRHGYVELVALLQQGHRVIMPL